MKLPKVKKLFKDPFFALIGVVVFVPALLIAYGIVHQGQQPTASINNISSNETVSGEVQGQSTSNQATEAPQPITQAEQSVIKERPVDPAANATPTPAAVLVCGQDRKQGSEATRNTQIAQENAQHERQKDKLRLISNIYRRYWDEEMVRHQQAVASIDSVFQAALAAARC